MCFSCVFFDGLIDLILLALDFIIIKDECQGKHVYIVTLSILNVNYTLKKRTDTKIIDIVVCETTFDSIFSGTQGSVWEKWQDGQYSTQHVKLKGKLLFGR